MDKLLFGTTKITQADGIVENRAGGAAVALSPKQALAQYAATGCFGSTFYASAEEQLKEVLELAKGVDSAFIAKTAVYARRHGHMKDMPALLLAVLAARSKGDPRVPVNLHPHPKLTLTSSRPSDTQAAFERAFPLVIDNAKMLSTFVQIVRSGVTGRKSFGTMVKRCIHRWLDDRSGSQLFRDSVGHTPSLADIVKMVHPHPLRGQPSGGAPAVEARRRAFYGYLVGKPHQFEDLPAEVREYEFWKKSPAELDPPIGLPFQMLDGVAGADPRVWKAIAKQAGWQMTRMNLNTFKRHGVFDDPELVTHIAFRLGNPELIAKARAMPYQLLAAAKHATDMPTQIHQALEQATEIACANVPRFDGRVVVGLDVSGSMRNPITGNRPGQSSKMLCVDVAAMFAAAVYRANPNCEVIPFDTQVYRARGESFSAGLKKQGISGFAQHLAAFGGGGTNCSLVLNELNKKGETADVVIYVSDNESWVDSTRYGFASFKETPMANEWGFFKRQNPRAKLICIDLTPHTYAQVSTREDCLNVGGFSDAVWNVIRVWLEGKSADAWCHTIDALTDL